MALKPQFLLPIALGFSVVTVTAFLVYYIFKNDEKDDNRKNESTKITVTEVQVPKKIVPALIGRNGGNIKEMQFISGASMFLKKVNDKDYDICVIRGNQLAAEIAEQRVIEFIKDQPVIVQKSMYIPNWACSRILGRGADDIRFMSRISGARIIIENDSNVETLQRKVNIWGTVEQITHAMDLIDHSVEQSNRIREIELEKSVSRLPLRTPTEPSTAESGESSPHVVKHAKYKTPDSGSAVEVYVSAVSSPSRFWVQFVGHQVTQLDELVSLMTNYYKNKDNCAIHALQHVSVGQVVAAVFRHDGRWYRARVHDIRPNEFDPTQQVADVFYLDYGDSAYIATNELCELRADFLRLRFQAMECFLAGVKPVNNEDVTNTSIVWAKWNPLAIDRFEDLTYVARWKPLMSQACTYKKTGGGSEENKIPGIKLFDVTNEGSLDIGEVLVAEGWAEHSAAPPSAHPQTPFGDLSSSRVLCMLDPSPSAPRSSSLPKDHRNENTGQTSASNKENETLASKSQFTDLEPADKIKSISNFDLTIPDSNKSKIAHGSQEFLTSERHFDVEHPGTPIHSKTALDEIKANMNRIDSHHSNLEALGHH